LRAALFLAFASIVALAARPARAEDAGLREGAEASIGTPVSELRPTLSAGTAFTVPLDGQPSGGVFGALLDRGSRVEITLSADASGAELEQARLQLIDLAHLRVLGLRRDREQGMPVGVELARVAAPFRVAGTSGGRDWIIARVGLGLEYRRLDESFGAERDGHVGVAAPLLRLDEQLTWLERVQLRAFQEVSYAAAAGALDSVMTWLSKGASPWRSTSGRARPPVSPGEPIRPPGGGSLG
jgi:hypothetical protein